MIWSLPNFFGDLGDVFQKPPGRTPMSNEGVFDLVGNVGCCLAYRNEPLPIAGDFLASASVPAGRGKKIM